MSEKEQPEKAGGNKGGDKEATKRKLALQGKYSQRITIAKNAREFFIAKDYVNATKKYNEYLSILAQAQGIEDIYEITPSKFDSKSDITEMLLISHVYWELARTYEMTPKLQKAYDKCLKQFVRFTVNQPYQVLNSEVLRKYIKKNKRVSKQIKALERAYSQIQVESKKCFVASFALGEDHWATEELRRFKRLHLSGPYGKRLVAFYYRISCPLTNWLFKNKNSGALAKVAAAPLLIITARFVKGVVDSNGKRD